MRVPVIPVRVRPARPIAPRRPRPVVAAIPRIGARVVAVAAALSLTGCAYLTTYTRSVDLGAEQAVALDIKQRVVFSRTVPLLDDQGEPLRNEDGSLVALPAGQPGKVMTCAEPSPDALTVLAASGGLSVNGGTSTAGKAVNLSGALSESGAFVGLRTPPIQILRDQMFSLCAAYAGGAYNDAEYKSQSRRFQSTVLGLVGIDNLTQHAVAPQALLVSAAQGQGGAGAGDAAVAAAQERVDTQTQKVTDDEKEVINQKAVVAQDDKDIADNATQVAAASKDGGTVPDALATQAKDLASKRTTDQAKLDGDNKQWEADKKTLQADLASLNAAQSRASASASGSGSLGQAAAASAQASAELVKGVRQIIQEVNLSYTRDECVELLSRLVYTRPADKKKPRASAPDKGGSDGANVQPPAATAAETDASGSTLRNTTVDMCVKVVTADSERQRLELQLKIAEAQRDTAKASLDLASLQAPKPATAPAAAAAPAVAVAKAAKAAKASPAAASAAKKG